MFQAIRDKTSFLVAETSLSRAVIAVFRPLASERGTVPACLLATHWLSNRTGSINAVA